MDLTGQPAPQFSLKAHTGEDITLEGFKGSKNVLLIFYPLDFTFVCPTEIRGFAQLEKQFLESNCQLIGASTDSQHSHKAWFERDLPEVKFPFPYCSLMAFIFKTPPSTIVFSERLVYD